jgi:DNA segregation ATPase FtsK/SpoIIIE, S-DNA-T family
MARRRGRRKKPFKIKLKKEIIYSVVSVIFLLLGLITLLSFTRQGVFLERVYIILSLAFGWTALMLPFLLTSLALLMTQLKWALTSPSLFLGGLLIFAGSLGLTQAGTLGYEAYASLAFLLTGFGSGAVYFGVILIGLMIMTNTPLEEFLLFIADAFARLRNSFSSIKTKDSFSADTKINISKNITSSEPDLKLNKKLPDTTKANSSTKDDSFESTLVSNKDGNTTIWKYPPLSILSAEKGAKADRGDIKESAHIIERTLDSFGIRARVAEVNGGPAVTQYAIKIKEGTKLSKIKALQTDLALALAAPTGQIRIEAPIPGRNLVGLEIPNRSAEFVTLHEVLSHKELKKTKSKLSVGLGLGVEGIPIMADIKKMPHVLIAGATGSGKSVCINTIITTLLYRNSPAELKLILIDPKRVELTGYNGIPHLMTPVITDSDRVIAALQWAVKEMDKRYKMFVEVGARNIEEYNDLSGFTAMNYLIIIIDELADIMLTAPSKVEDLIVRLAQMARATGIHLVIATQRPSVNVITGLIKANIPTRIAFNVTSMIDSRVIIDTPGAEKLLGKGDMLYVPPDRPLPTRIQGTYVTNKEIKALIDYLKKSAPVAVEYEQEVTEKYLKPEGDTLSGQERDALFMDAVGVVCAAGKASTSYLQRRMSIGYNRSAKIMDQLEKAGIIGPPDGVKPRAVLITSPDQFTAREASEA